MEVGSLLVNLNVDLSALQRGLEQAKVATEGLGNKLQSAMQRAETGSMALAGALAGVAIGVGAVSVKAVTMAGQMEQSRIAFTTMLGSAEEADTFLRELYDFAAKTPFEFEGLQNASRQLLAFGFEAEELIPMMTSIGNAVAGLGGGEFEIQRVTRALGQMQAKGKVSAEEMMQLAEMGIPAWDILASKIGTDIPTAMESARKGGIPAAEAIEALVAGMNERFPNMMEKQSTTLLGMWSTLKDNISMSLVAIGEEIVTTFDLKDKLSGAIEALSRISDLLQQEGLKGALAQLFPPDVQAKIVMIAGAIAGALIPALIAMAAAFWGAMAPLLPFMAAGAAVAGLAYLIYTNWSGIEGFFVGLWEGVRTSTSAAWEAIQTALGQVWQAVNDFFFNVTPVGIIIKHWDDISLATTTTWTTISTWLSGLWERIRTQLTTAWTTIRNTVSDIWTEIRTGFDGLVKAAWNWGTSLLGMFIDGVKSRIASLVSTLSSIGDTVAGFLGFRSPTELGAGRFADEWAPNFIKMFADGLRAGIPQVEFAVSGLSERLSALSPAALSPSATTSNVSHYGGNTFQIYVSGGAAGDQADGIIRELRKRGVKL